MYEQNEVPVLRRILLLTLWFILIVAILWVAVWFVFFRNDSKKSADTSSKSTQTQTQSQNKDNTSNTDTPSDSQGSSSASSSASSATPPISSTPSTTSTPNELANTGAGNVIAPAVGAMIAGSAIYYIRLRRKITD